MKTARTVLVPFFWVDHTVEAGDSPPLRREVDLKKMGFEIVALIGIDTTPESFISALEQLRDMEEVVSLYSSSGDHMILLEGWFKNMDELAKFVKKLESIEGITKICPAILLEKIK